MTIFWIVLAVLIIWAVFAYNAFIRLRTQTNEAWADIDVQLKRRYDLIPNLIETVKGYAKHERETLDAVITARNNATQVHVDANNLDAVAMEKMSQAEMGLSGALGKLFALSENYPDLKANQNFVELQRELTDTENKIQAARRFFNANVRDLNMKVDMFPSNIVARIFGFAKREYFELEEGSEEKENVKVKF